MLNPEFRVRRIGQRYDCAQVDALVARILATAERRSVGPDVTVGELRDVAFRTPLLGPGYPVEEVDNFLIEAERWLPGGPATGVVAGPGGAPLAGGSSVRGGRTAPRFSTVRLREGYAIDEVDEFVERVMATVNGLPVSRPVTADEIRRVQFRPVRLSEGYDIVDVDAFLDTAEEWLR
jgi:DivIVA domain-containing protein